MDPTAMFLFYFGITNKLLWHVKSLNTWGIKLWNPRTVVMASFLSFLCLPVDYTDFVSTMSPPPPFPPPCYHENIYTRPKVHQKLSITQFLQGGYTLETSNKTQLFEFWDLLTSWASFVSPQTQLLVNQRYNLLQIRPFLNEFFQFKPGFPHLCHQFFYHSLQSFSGVFLPHSVPTVCKTLTAKYSGELCAHFIFYEIVNLYFPEH